MIDHSTLYTLLKTLNIPVAYDHFDEDKTLNPPALVYRENGAFTLKADNKVYSKLYYFEIELVTSKKDVALEEQLESLLTNNNIPFEKDDEEWDSNEKIYHIFYEI